MQYDLQEPPDLAVKHSKIRYPFRFRESPKGYFYYKRKALLHPRPLGLVDEFYRIITGL